MAKFAAVTGYFVFGLCVGINFVLTTFITLGHIGIMNAHMLSLFYLSIFLLTIGLYIGGYCLFEKMDVALNRYTRITLAMCVSIIITVSLDMVFTSIVIPFYNQMLISFLFFSALYILGITNIEGGSFFFEEVEEEQNVKNA